MLKFIFVPVCVHMPVRGCQKTTLESQFSTSTLLKQGVSCFLLAGPQISKQLSCLPFP